MVEVLPVFDTAATGEIKTVEEAKRAVTTAQRLRAMLSPLMMPIKRYTSNTSVFNLVFLGLEEPTVANMATHSGQDTALFIPIRCSLCSARPRQYHAQTTPHRQDVRYTRTYPFCRFCLQYVPFLVKVCMTLFASSWSANKTSLLLRRDDTKGTADPRSRCHYTGPTSWIEELESELRRNWRKDVDPFFFSRGLVMLAVETGEEDLEKYKTCA